MAGLEMSILNVDNTTLYFPSHGASLSIPDLGTICPLIGRLHIGGI